MKPSILIVGPGTSRLLYTLNSRTGRLEVRCPECGATATVSRGVRDVNLAHDRECRWLAGIERRARRSGKGGSNGFIH
jgi:hypothetical protein